MDNRLVAFLKNCIANKGEPYTHTSLITPKKRYFVDGDKEEEFWELYCKVISEGGVAGITEKPETDRGPVIVDLDLRHDPEETGLERQYTEDTVKDIVKFYQDELRNIIADENPRSLICVVLEKESPRIEKGQVKDGFHLHFPFCVIDPAIQKTVLRDRVVDKIIERKMFGTKIKVTNKVDKVVDDNVPGVCWLLYGSKKAPTLEAFSVSKIFDSHLKELTLEQTFRYKAPKPFRTDKSALESLIEDRKKILQDRTPSERRRKERRLSRKNKGRKKKKKKIREEKEENKTLIIFEDVDVEEEQHPVEYYLPKHLSIRGSNINTKIKDNILTRTKPNKKKHRLTEMRKKTPNEVNEDLNNAKVLIGMLKKERAEEYRNWMEIGWMLNNIGLGCGRALDMWIEFSKKSEKWKDGECEDEWDKMKFGDLGMGTLCHYAKSDNPNKYKEWKDQNISTYLFKAITWGSHYDIAKALHRKYEYQFVCANVEKKLWYEFKNHHWIKIDDGTSLRAKISTALIDEFLKVDIWYSQQMLNSENEEQRSNLEDRKKRIVKLIGNLKNSTFKNSVMKECLELFQKEGFLEKLDSNTWLIGFDNGVYDLKAGYFREGRPEDYISLSVGYNYRDFESDDDEVIEVEEYLEDVFVNPALRKYFLRFASSCLRGGNVNKLFQVWSGEGDNSKSIVVELLEKAFGAYRIKFPTSLLTGKRTQSSGATPEMARIQGVRIAFLQEPDNAANMNIGIIKELTGCDSVYVRGLYKSGKEVKPMFKLILICNKKPKVPSEDKATWNRIRVLPYESTFSDDAPDTREEQVQKKTFPKDPNFGAKIPRMVHPFMWLLLKEFEQYKKHGIREPPEVKKATNSYRKDNDIYLQFVDENIVEKKGSKLKISEIWSIFKDWFRDGYPSYKPPTRAELKEDLIKKWGPPKGYYWKDYALREDEDDELEGE